VSQSIKDYYSILGVSKGASQEEIKKAFRVKARECHPDVCDDEDGEERFKAINEAYEVLSDPRKREVYDQFGTADPRAAGVGGFDGVPFEDIFGMGMEDVFSMFFGGVAGGVGRRGRPRRDGRDLAMQIALTLEEVATGVEKEVEIRRDAPCPECDASGGKDANVTSCPDCGGSGRKTVTRQTMLGAMRTVAPCERCGETGEVVENACAVCNGSGRAPTRETVEIEIPAGVQDGARLRIQDRGEAGLRGAASGSLLVTVRVQPHERIFRDGDDLHVQVRVPMTVAALGGDVRFAGLMYEETVSVPAGSQHGEVVRIKGRGMPKTRGKGTGDLYVHVAVDVPKPSRKERALLEELREKRQDGEEPASVDRLGDWLGHR
jgi:molecular chaperone DnaJ